jgi:hypothetical protein
MTGGSMTGGSSRPRRAAKAPKAPKAPAVPECHPEVRPYVEVTQTTGADGAAVYRAAFGVRLIALTPDRDERKLTVENLADARLADQADFINSLWSADAQVTYALRLLCTPLVASPLGGEISLCLFGQVAAASESEAVERAGALAQGLRLLCGAHFPDAEWATLIDEADFAADWRPFDWSSAHAVEICRRTDHVDLESGRDRPGLGKRGAGDRPKAGGNGAVFFVHPFLPRLSTWERLLRVLLHASHPTALTVALTPTSLSTAEREGLLREIVKCEQALAEAGGSADTVHAARAHALRGVIEEQLARLADAPFLLRVTLAAPCPPASGVADAVAVEMTAPVGARSGFLREGAATLLQAGGYDLRTVPADDGLSRLEPMPAGESPEDLTRLPWLVDGHEAATAFRLPIATRDGLPGLLVRSARRRPIPRVVALHAPEGGVHLGESRQLDHGQPVFVSERDRRQHMYVVGQTGTGKTTLLKHMVLDDICAGRGVAVIDPHGDLFEELLASIPAERWDDVVVLDPTDIDNPVGLNLLQCDAAEDRHLVVREMHAIMSRLLHDQYGAKSQEFTGPIFFQHMQMNMLLAMSDPDHPGTLLQFYEIYRTPSFYKRWLPLVWTDHMLDRWVSGPLTKTDYLARSGSDISVGEYLSSKFDDFVFDPMLRSMFGQSRSTIDLLDIMDSGKILLVNLAKGQLSEQNSRFLGMVIMAKLQVAAMRRGRQAKEQRAPFFLYVDEFQNLATENFVLMLSEARKFGLGLVLANQFVSQIDNQRIVDAIFGNVGTLCAFRVGRKDAGMLESQFAPYFSEHDLANLPNWEACLRTTVGGQMAPPFTVNTVVRDDLPASEDTAREVRARSARVYGRPRADVDAEITESLRPRASAPARRRAPSPEMVGKLIRTVDAMAAARDAGNLMAECDLCIHFAEFCGDAGEAKKAMSALERVLNEAAKETVEPDGDVVRTVALTQSAEIKGDTGDLVQAKESLLAELERDRAHGKTDLEIADLRRLADVSQRMGDEAGARAATEEAAALAGKQAAETGDDV